jgi:hypothetical protein
VQLCVHLAPELRPGEVGEGGDIGLNRDGIAAGRRDAGNDLPGWPR